MFRIAAAVLTMSAALLTTGCAAFDDGAPSDGSSSKSDGKLNVITALYPLQFIAERVGGKHVDVTNLTRPGQEPHDLELTPVESGRVAVADVVVYEKGLQAAVDDAIGQATGVVVDAAEVAGLEPIDHGGHDDAAVDEHGHEEGEFDPHFWQDPLKVAKVADAVAASFTKADPANAADYSANAAALDGDLAKLDADFTAGLAHCERSTVVVSHDAFGYLTRYGLDFAPIAGLSPDAEPTPADLARLQKLIKSDGITTVFGETLVSAALTTSLADDMGITTAILDPIEGLTDTTSDQTYLTLMQKNLAALRKANSCS